MPDQPAPLNEDDLKQVDDLQMSSDPNERAQAAAIAKTMSPGEQHRFFVVQQSRRGGNERSRSDNQLLGMPPEGAVVTGLAAGVPAARALTSAGTTVAQKALGAAGGIMTGVSPIIKYEVTKEALHFMGLPSVIAIPTAMAISGYRGKGAAPAARAAETVAPTAAADASAPTMAAPSVTPEMPAQTMSNGEPSMVSPEAVTARQQAGTTVASKPMATAEETREYLRLKKLGKTDADAKQIIEAQKAMRDRFGLPTGKDIKIEQDYVGAHGRRQQ